MFEAIKLHLRSKSYDFFKYNGKVKKVNHPVPHIKFLINKLENEQQFMYYILANQIQYYLSNGKFCTFFPEIISEDCLKVYEKFRNELKSSDSILYSDIESLLGNDVFKELKDVNKVLRMMYSKKLHLFTIIQLYKFTKLSEYWDHDDPLSEDFINFIDRISDFFKFKKEIFSEIVKKFQNTN